jgi:hypothetical protein
MDNSDYMGMNVPLEQETEEQKLSPNAEKQDAEAEATARIQLAFKELKTILEAEKSNVMLITDLPDLKGAEMDGEIIARKRYTNLINVLLSKLEVK